MKFFFNLIFLISSVAAFNRNVRSCSNDLRTAFHSLIRGDQVTVAVPKSERNMHVLTIPELMNQSCNQELFSENLVHNSFLNRKLHQPSFLINPFYQSPQDRCHIFHRQHVDLEISNTLSHRADIPNSVFETYLLFSIIAHEARITRLMEEPNIILRFPRDADTILFIFYVLNSFFERHTSITCQLFTKPANSRLQKAIKPCYVELRDLPLLKSVRYLNASSNEDAHNIAECNLQLWTAVEFRHQIGSKSRFQVANPSPSPPEIRKITEFIIDGKRQSLQERNYHLFGLRYEFKRETLYLAFANHCGSYTGQTHTY